MGMVNWKFTEYITNNENNDYLVPKLYLDVIS